MLSRKELIYTITNLPSYYNHQLANIGGIIEESAERDCVAMKLIAKVILN